MTSPICAPFVHDEIQKIYGAADLRPTLQTGNRRRSSLDTTITPPGRSWQPARRFTLLPVRPLRVGEGVCRGEAKVGSRTGRTVRRQGPAAFGEPLRLLVGAVEVVGVDGAVTGVGDIEAISDDVHAGG